MLLTLQEGSAGPAAGLGADGGLKAADDGGCWVEEAPSRAQKQEGKGLHPSHLAVEYL